jgi:hypothetical protein
VSAHARYKSASFPDGKSLSPLEGHPRGGMSPRSRRAQLTENLETELARKWCGGTRIEDK